MPILRRAGLFALLTIALVYSLGCRRGDYCPGGCCPDQRCPRWDDDRDRCGPDGCPQDDWQPDWQITAQDRPGVLWCESPLLIEAPNGRVGGIATPVKFRLSDPEPFLRMLAGETLPQADLPLALRQKNWLGKKNQGSCVHASLIMSMRWQNLMELADWWRQNHGDGEYSTGLARKLEAAGVKFAYVDNGNESFLDWCHRTRRACAVTFKPSHMCFLIHCDQNTVMIIDNNRPEQIERHRRADFMRAWKGYGGWAVTPIATPAPPVPYRQFEAIEPAPAAANDT